MQAKALAPNSASEMRMAHAVAEATAAAAAAASAAASAASTCQVSVQKFRQPPAAPPIGCSYGLNQLQMDSLKIVPKEAGLLKYSAWT